MNSFISGYKKELTRLYPKLQTEIERHDWSRLISPFRIPIRKELFQKACRFVDEIFRLTHQPIYQQLVKAPDAEIARTKAPNYSLLMGYDFHIENDKIKLIEINTNASGYLLAQPLYSAHGLPFPAGPQVPFARTVKKPDSSSPADTPLDGRQEVAEPIPLRSLRDAFTVERELCASARHTYGSENLAETEVCLAIVDEAPTQQKMYIEFLFFEHLLRDWGYQAVIHDVADLVLAHHALQTPDGRKIDFVYNRSTDFYFQQPQSHALRQAYTNCFCCVSPQPKEYLWLADKERLIELSQPEFIEQLALSPETRQLFTDILIPTYDIHQRWPSADDLWQDRKELFFKPKQSFGGKQAFRGKSMSQKVFAEIWDAGGLAQEYVPAGHFDAGDGNEWKYDLRLYAYQGQVQLAVARVYQGQVTNFRQVGGGFAAVVMK